MTLQEHLKPRKFEIPIDEPIPPKLEIYKLEKMRERGLEVEYRMPDWVKEDLEEGKEIMKDNERIKKEIDFEFPVKRYPGMGQSRVRKRKEKLFRMADYGF